MNIRADQSVWRSRTRPARWAGPWVRSAGLEGADLGTSLRRTKSAFPGRPISSARARRFGHRALKKEGSSEGTEGMPEVQGRGGERGRTRSGPTGYSCESRDGVGGARGGGHPKPKKPFLPGRGRLTFSGDFTIMPLPTLLFQLRPPKKIGAFEIINVSFGEFTGGSLHGVHSPPPILPGIHGGGRAAAAGAHGGGGHVLRLTKPLRRCHASPLLEAGPPLPLFVLFVGEWRTRHLLRQMAKPLPRRRRRDFWFGGPGYR
ncbi:hypothetical protein NL676_037504 [Syzygium grande]|nr:hypothetical protein NL676_037504 [Syzygium grande]